MTVVPSPDVQYADAAALLRVLGSPVRMAIVADLDLHGERCVHELVDALGVTQPLVSQHLAVLRRSRLVTARREGREMRYRNTDEHVIHIVRDARRHAEEAP